MNNTKKLLLRASEKLDLPADILAGVPRIELLGNDRCSIEPQLGLLEYSENRVCVSTALGAVNMFGNGLRIKEMNARRIVVSGRLHRVSFAEEDE